MVVVVVGGVGVGRYAFADQGPVRPSWLIARTWKAYWRDPVRELAVVVTVVPETVQDFVSE